MKLSNLFWNLLGIMVLSACSNSDMTENDPSETNVDARFMSVDITNTTGFRTRAAGDQSGDLYEEGESVENDVESVRFYFFKENGSPCSVKSDGTNYYDKGYASPESPYSHNRDLAIGRTAALKNHIKQLYHFNDSVIVTEYEPEDWKGLRQYVEKSNLVHRSEILGMIDSSLDPDAKEAKIKRTYPEEYRFLLQNCYPALRHTDYRIDYTIRSFSDVEEIKRIMQTQPQKLSLNEFYLVAQTYEPGSVEFNDVFETAVRMYPNDEIANLNAANSAMQRKDVENAKRYLQKGGDSPEALYARGVYAFLVEDYTVARKQLNEAKNKGVQQAEIILLEIDKIDK